MSAVGNTPRLRKIVRKANDDLVSFCECAAPIATTGQLDCPWCGCGWLFSCATCHKAFTFGEVVETPMTDLDVAKALCRDDAPEDHEAKGAIEWLDWELEDKSIGDRVVYLDGAIVDVRSREVAFNGWFARHELTAVPHAVARDRNELDAQLGDKTYWLERELAEEDKA